MTKPHEEEAWAVRLGDGKRWPHRFALKYNGKGVDTFTDENAAHDRMNERAAAKHDKVVRVRVTEVQK